MEPKFYVINAYLFEGLEYSLHFYVDKMVEICKKYFPSEGEKKMDNDNKE